jgi:hypothetical protein
MHTSLSLWERCRDTASGGGCREREKKYGRSYGSRDHHYHTRQIRWCSQTMLIRKRSERVKNVAYLQHKGKVHKL